MLEVGKSVQHYAMIVNLKRQEIIAQSIILYTRISGRDHSPS